MKLQFAALSIATMSVILASSPLVAGDESHGEKTIILGVQNDQIDIQQVDISDLLVGEAETIFTQDGKTVDILRTQEGFDIYIDGEELDIPMPDPASLDGLHSEKHISIHAIGTAHHDGRVRVIRTMMDHDEIINAEDET